MTATVVSKRLTYIVNYLSADDSQHFVHIPNLLREMEKLGWTIDLVSERGGEGETEVLGLKVTFLSKTSKVGRLFNLVRQLFRMRWSGGQLVFVRISKWTALLSAILGRIFDWRTVYWLSGTLEDFNRRQGPRGQLEFVIRWVLLRLVDRLATGPETMLAYYRDAYGLPESKLALLYNDIGLNRSSSRSVDNTNAPRVLMVHRLSPVRETDRYLPEIINALHRHSIKRAVRISLDICGDGPEREALEKQCVHTFESVSIRFHGTVPQRELSDFYERSTIFVMPSYREGFPRVIIEAMAHGLPIVATNAGGTRDICGPAQQQFVVDRDNSEAFGKAIEDLLDSPTKRKILASENLKSVRRFSTPVVARMYDRELSAMIGAEPALEAK